LSFPGSYTAQPLVSALSDGGWTGPGGNPCQTQSTDPALTVIDGQGLRGGPQLSHQAGGGFIIVRNLAFQNGHRQEVNFDNSNRGGGLYIRVKT
jgi:hypothetical protein